jgi:hypothetical protein
MHTTGMLMRGHRNMEGLSYIRERLDTDTRGGREVTEGIRRVCCKGDELTPTTGVLTRGQRRKKRLCSDGNVSKDDNSDGNCRFTLIMK